MSKEIVKFAVSGTHCIWGETKPFKGLDYKYYGVRTGVFAVQTLPGETSN